MKVGMNMLLWTTDVREEHYPLMAELRAGGFDGIELMLNPERDTAHREALSAELFLPSACLKQRFWNG